MTIEELRASTDATVTIKVVAGVLGVDPRTVAGELSVHGGEIPARRVGRRIVVPRAGFLAWFDGEGDKEPAAPAVEQPDRGASEVEALRARLLEVLLLEDGRRVS